MRVFLVTYILMVFSSVAISVDEQLKDVIVTLHVNLDSRMTCFYQALRNTMSLSVYVDPSSQARLAVRLTSPSGDYSEWTEGQGGSVHVMHNVTENGDHEVCISAPHQVKVLFHLYAFDPNQQESELQQLAKASEIDESFTKVIALLGQHLYQINYSLKFSNQISVRDKALQQRNANFIRNYVIVFCITAIAVALVEVAFIRRLFHVDTSRVRA